MRSPHAFCACRNLTLVAWTVLAGAPRASGDAVTDIVINEVMYNPASGDRNDEFIELLNTGTQAYNLQGFHFTSGLVFTFPNVTIGPGEYLVVCANQARIRQLYDITNTVGDWDATTSLDNGGERIKLVDNSDPPVEVEDFTYNDRNPWPILADGYGHSLERRKPTFDNDTPANWSASVPGSAWTRVVFTGIATSSRLYLFLTEAGTAYVDDIKLYPVGNPGDNRMQNGGFESATLSPWQVTGTHDGSVSSTEQHRSGSKSLKIVATGAGWSTDDSVYQEGLGLTNGREYTLEFYLLVTEPGQTLTARLSQSDAPGEFYLQASGGGATPGKQNSVYATDIPPFVFPAGQSPAIPVASTNVTLLASVWDDVAVASVTAHWDSGMGERTAAMLDDGNHGDGAAGDGLFGAGIGSFGTGTIVRYWITAKDSANQDGRFPFEGNPTHNLGFYIQPSGINPAFQARSNTGLVSDLLPVYHLLIDTSQLEGNPPHLTQPWDSYRRGTFVFNGEVFDNVRVRHRGQTSMWTPKKHWKVDFNKDHRFLTPFENHPEVDNINLQSGYGDKAFIREWLAYKAMMDAKRPGPGGTEVGRPGLEMWHVRLYINGQYRGFYMNLENIDENWMDRVGMDKEGWLWKSYSEAKGGTGGFETEEDAGRAADAQAALGDFISNMNNLSGQALVDYINENMDVETFIDFLAVHQLTHDADHPAKNYLVYADEDQPAGSWTYLLWDADLSHGRNFECTGTAGGGGVYNDWMRWDFWGDPKLLFGTQVRPKCDGPWNGVINAFLNRTTAFQAQYYDRVAELLVNLYHPDVLNPIIEEMTDPFIPEVALDWQRNPPDYGYTDRRQPDDYPWHVSELERFVDQRYNYLANALANLSAPDIDNLACARQGDDARLTWTNGATYQSIKVYRNSRLLATLAGTATSTTQPLDLGTPLNSFKVASVTSGGERAGKTCSIIVSAGGYTTVIDEGFSPPAPTSELAVNCSATQTGGYLQLTPPEGTQAGSAFFVAPVSDADFIADFDLRLEEPSDPGADGMTFIINTGNETDICGAAGGALGYFDGDGGTPVFPGYAVVFDTWQNTGEPSHNWIGFIDTAVGSAPVEAVDVPEELNGNGTFHLKVLGKAGAFSCLVSNSSIGMTEREIFSYTAPGFTAKNVYFGFSAGTGGAYARHIVDNFVLQINTGSTAVTADFTASVTSGLAPLDVQFTNKSTNASSYLWDFGDGATSTSINPRHTYDDPGTYSVKLTATGTGGSDTETKSNYISVAQPVHAEFIATPTVGKAPLDVAFTNQSTGASSYLWNFGDGTTSTQAAPSHRYSSAGQYTVSLTVSGAGGTQDTMSRTNYIQIDSVLDADFVGNPTSGAAPLTVKFLDTSVGSTVTSWLWDFGDGATSTEQHPSHIYTADGTYTVQLQIFGYSQSNVETKLAYITVGDTAKPTFIRGDTNGDRKVDISDPVSTLNFLFLGAASPNCQDAADVNDSGLLDITDGIYTLAFLFQGGPEPAPPYPLAGEDTTADALPDCERFE